MSDNPPVPPTPPTVAQFRAMFPEFSDSSVYIDELIQPWITLAAGQLDACRWGPMWALGVELFTAHQIVLQRQATILAQRGAVPGLSTGLLQSKSINGVSVSYNTNLSFIAGAGDWNLTVYGVRFIGWAHMFGSGGVQIVGSDAAMVTEAQLISGVTPFPNF